MYRNFFKRIIDFTLALIALIVLSPLMLIVAIVTAIKMKGNPFFVQPRPGKNEKIFKLIKFRSMTEEKDENGNYLPDEVRLTLYGKFLRRTSLDELPQLFNIFVGHMSFIGPRPQQDEEHEKKLYDARKSCEPDSFLVRPGLCGLAIVKMHRSHDPMEKARYDSDYVRDLSLGMDVKIFFIAFGILLGFNKKDRGR